MQHCLRARLSVANRGAGQPHNGRGFCLWCADDAVVFLDYCVVKYAR